MSPGSAMCSLNCRPTWAAHRRSLPSDFAQKGGLIAYGPDLLALYPQASVMTRKLLQGASAADLPIERPTRFKLIANLKTASALGLTLPTSILLSADEVIE
jgi:putative ABC transport system substrate-binding protein